MKKSILLGIIIGAIIALVAVAIFTTPRAHAAFNNDHHECEHNCNPSPTPTPTPKPKVVLFTGVSDGGATHPTYRPESCGGIYASKPIVVGKRISPTVVQANWWPVTNADKYSLVFGYTGENIGMGAYYMNNLATSVDINFLHQNQSVQLQIWAWKGQCITKSDTIIVR